MSLSVFVTTHLLVYLLGIYQWFAESVKLIAVTERIKNLQGAFGFSFQASQSPAQTGNTTEKPEREFEILYKKIERTGGVFIWVLPSNFRRDPWLA